MVSRKIHTQILSQKQKLNGKLETLNKTTVKYKFQCIGEREKQLVKRVLREIEEFNGMTPSDAIEYIKSYLIETECDDERLSDAVKRLQLLIEEAK